MYKTPLRARLTWLIVCSIADFYFIFCVVIYRVLHLIHPEAFWALANKSSSFGVTFVSHTWKISYTHRRSLLFYRNPSFHAQLVRTPNVAVSISRATDTHLRVYIDIQTNRFPTRYSAFPSL